MIAATRAWQVHFPRTATLNILPAIPSKLGPAPLQCKAAPEALFGI
jgi:hypothetical protein